MGINDWFYFFSLSRAKPSAGLRSGLTFLEHFVSHGLRDMMQSVSDLQHRNDEGENMLIVAIKIFLEKYRLTRYLKQEQKFFCLFWFCFQYVCSLFAV